MVGAAAFAALTIVCDHFAKQAERFSLGLVLLSLGCEISILRDLKRCSP